MRPKIITLGVYGSSEAEFFQALVGAQVDTFCDLRRRRGMRGSAYSFVNSVRLQAKLVELGIRYFHFKELAPTQTTRDKQKEADANTKVAKRVRESLGTTFIESYREECLSEFESTRFIQELGTNAEVVALFCVEREPEACHRSLVAGRLHQDLGLVVEHLLP